MTVRQLRMVLDRVMDNDEVRIVNLKASIEFNVEDAFDIPDQEAVVVILTTGASKGIKADRKTPVRMVI